jgi:hypothetical protein
VLVGPKKLQHVHGIQAANRSAEFVRSTRAKLPRVRLQNDQIET